MDKSSSPPFSSSSFGLLLLLGRREKTCCLRSLGMYTCVTPKFDFYYSFFNFLSTENVLSQHIITLSRARSREREREREKEKSSPRRQKKFIEEK